MPGQSGFHWTTNEKKKGQIYFSGVSSVLKDKLDAPWMMPVCIFVQILFINLSVSPVSVVLQAQPAFQTASHCSQRETNTHIATLKYIFV